MAGQSLRFDRVTRAAGSLTSGARPPVSALADFLGAHFERLDVVTSSNAANTTHMRWQGRGNVPARVFADAGKLPDPEQPNCRQRLQVRREGGRALTLRRAGGSIGIR